MDIPGFIDLVPGSVLIWRLLGAVVSSGDQPNATPSLAL